MTMMTAEQYEESLRRLNLVVYMFGKQLDNVVDDPIIRPSMQAVAKTYEMAHRPEHEDIMTATSHITGKKINRFTHIHQNIDDLVKKSKMGRLLGRETGCCFQRCVGMDALNALSIVTYNMDKKYGQRIQSAFFKVSGICTGKRSDLRRCHDRPQRGPQPAAPQAGRSRPLPSRGRREKRRYCRQRRQGPPDRCG